MFCRKQSFASVGSRFQLWAAIFILGKPFAFVGGHLHLWAVISINGWLLAFVGGWFHHSLSLAWEAVSWLSLVVWWCGGYDG